MRIECGSCHELVDATFAVDAGSIVATCPKCDAKTRVEDRTATPPEPEPAAPAPRELCPKCGAARSDAPACATCGLAADKAAAYLATRDAAVPPLVHATWKRAVEAWADPARHDAVFRIVADTGCYAWAAAMYRDAVTLRGDDTSKQMLERIRKGAEIMMYATRTEPRRPSRLLRAVFVVVVGALVVFALYAAYLMSRGSATGDDPQSSQVR
jgi:hypothetical protein